MAKRKLSKDDRARAYAAAYAPRLKRTFTDQWIDHFLYLAYLAGYDRAKREQREAK